MVGSFLFVEFYRAAWDFNRWLLLKTHRPFYVNQILFFGKQILLSFKIKYQNAVRIFLGPDRGFQVGRFRGSDVIHIQAGILINNRARAVRITNFQYQHVDRVTAVAVGVRPIGAGRCNNVYFAKAFFEMYYVEVLLLFVFIALELLVKAHHVR